MSHRAVSGQQFGEQLKMFYSPQEIIDTMDKADSRYRIDNPDATPREQWEKKRPHEVSLRDERRAELRNEGQYKNLSWDDAPPVAIFHGGASGRLRLSDGHHRLAHAEAAGIPYMAVEHYFPKAWR